jgi:hypothetical protein
MHLPAILPSLIKFKMIPAAFLASFYTSRRFIPVLPCPKRFIWDPMNRRVPALEYGNELLYVQYESRPWPHLPLVHWCLP